jgi:diguanylate cyclase (GGDEF)-like protein/PAS domain S-box-containing protein
MVDLQDFIELLEGSPFGISIARRSDGIIVFANRAFTDMLGVDRADYIGTPARKWIIGETNRSGAIETLKSNQTVEGFEVEYRRADGMPVCVMITIRPAVFNGEKVNLAWMVDITLRKDAEKAARAAAEAVEQARASIQGLLEGSPFGVSVSRRSDGRVVFANKAFTRMLGISQEAFIGSRARSWFVDDAQRAAIVRELKTRGVVDNAEAEFRRVDGSSFWVLITIREDNFLGEPVNLAWIADITERKIMEGRLELAAKVVEVANEGIVVTDADTKIEAVNGAFSQITGFTAGEVVGSFPSVLASGRHTPEFFEAMWDEIGRTSRWQGEVWNRRKDGGVYLEWLSIAAVRDADGKVAHYLGIFSDITARKENEEQVWRQANFDSLTGLPNRAHFLAKLSEIAADASREGGGFAVLFIDLDGFKAVNDTFGHAAGDLLLQLTAERLRAVVRAADTVARLSGDEFAVIARGIHSAQNARRVAQKMLEVLAAPFDLGAGEAKVGASIGIARFPQDGTEPALLLEQADQAMYGIKRGGKNGVAIFGEATEGAR